MTRSQAAFISLSLAFAASIKAQVIDSFSNGSWSKLLKGRQNLTVSQSVSDVVGGVRKIEMASIGNLTVCQINQSSSRGSAYVYGSTSLGSTVAFSYGPLATPIRQSATGSLKFVVATLSLFGTPATVRVTITSGANNVSVSGDIPVTARGTYTVPLSSFTPAPGKSAANLDAISSVSVKTTLGSAVSSLSFSEFSF